MNGKYSIRDLAANEIENLCEQSKSAVDEIMWAQRDENFRSVFAHMLRISNFNCFRRAQSDFIGLMVKLSEKSVKPFISLHESSISLDGSR